MFDIILFNNIYQVNLKAPKPSAYRINISFHHFKKYLKLNPKLIQIYSYKIDII